ncbi:MAG: hypothetical protein LBD53_06445 [Tannerella sp.]|jgi:hypothetical protein|nr:hypothetical protein [Tannerella sp.]
MTVEEIKKAVPATNPEERKRLKLKYGHYYTISKEERAAALRGERIDHHLTEHEAEMCGYPDYDPEWFNKYGTPSDFSGLYSLRNDRELSLFYSSISLNISIPKNMESDYIFVENIDDYR